MDNLLKAEDFIGSDNYKSIRSNPVDSIKHKLSENLRKGAIDVNLYNKAIDQLDELVIGKRVGKIRDEK